eukprot:1684955-Prorocentrum_lima.AAC.1
MAIPQWRCRCMACCLDNRRGCAVHLLDGLCDQGCPVPLFGWLGQGVALPACGCGACRVDGR